ncbi:MAG: ribosome biogenesis GTPase Der [Alphaproteobacteria bacterium]|nr:ribosome biogenesis GTPase Der [Alphaproteobacteria bacterium]
MPGNNASIPDGHIPTIAIVGRPNVGKSTLFNRLVGYRRALVHDQPGVTRDRREELAEFGGLTFTIVDTPGLMDSTTQKDNPLLAEGMKQQTIQAIHQADVILFVIDGKDGCTSYEKELATILRRHSKPILVLVNKTESKRGQDGIAEAIGLGLGDVIPIAAEHGLGMADLVQALYPYFPPLTMDDDDDQYWEDFKKSDKNEPIIEKPLKLAIIGRPNVGKSTLVNSFLGEDRQLTADMPGVTRDSITLDWIYKNRKIHLIDTAGIRRQCRVQESLEKLAVMDATRTIQYAEMVVLVIDASTDAEHLIEKQDLSLASDVIEEGRGLILALNKWDKVKDKEKLFDHIQHQLNHHLTQARDIACVPISALQKDNLDDLMNAVLATDKNWNQKFSTSQMNQWLQFTVTAHPPPTVSGRRIRLKYMTQAKTRPPTFLIFCSKATEVPDSYKRYLVNSMRKDFKLPGVPIRISFRSSKNPYA